MNTRERIRKILNFEKPDRLPVIEWASWWTQTVARWETEGMPGGMNLYERQEYFGLDVLVQQWISPRTPDLPRPAFHGAPILSTMEEYEAFRKSGCIHNPDAVSFDWFERYREKHEAGEVAFWFTLDGFFWFPRTLLGIEPHLLSFYDQPELLHKMNQDHVDFSLKVLERMFSRFRPEFMTFAEDLSYNHGPMLSREFFDEFLAPYYRQLLPILKENGVKVLVDSDGDISECLGWFQDAGLGGILPLERMAGVDVAALRERYPQQIFVGGFDKTVMHLGEAALRKEFERLLPVARKSGYMISCDHQTPPAVSLEDYRLYLKLFREYAVMI